MGGIPSEIKSDEFRNDLTNNIIYELENEAFKCHSRGGKKKYFSRDRKMTLSRLIITIMFFKSAIQRELDRFFKAISDDDFNIREVTKGALTQARAKLNPDSFKRLNTVAVNTFYSKVDYNKWHGMRLLAIDGSTLVLPNHKTVVEEFGQHKFGPKADSKRSLATVSMLYDVLNLLTIDHEMSPYDTGERELLQGHISHIGKGDLLLLDRGYPCYWLFFLLKSRGVEWCARLKSGWWVDVRKFVESGEKEALVTFTMPKKDMGKLAGTGVKAGDTITCRLVRVVLDTGEVEVLCTSLTDTTAYPHEVFEELYHLRWGVEEGYKLYKSRIEVEDFSGKTARAVRQDFYAKMFLMTLTAAYAFPIAEKVVEEFKADENRKHDQKINRTNAIACMRDILVPLFLKKKVDKSINSFDTLVYKTREIIRKGRKCPRNHKPKKAFCINYKRL
jgi:hypothetical protein